MPCEKKKRETVVAEYYVQIYPNRNSGCRMFKSQELHNQENQPKNNNVFPNYITNTTTK